MLGTSLFDREQEASRHLDHDVALEVVLEALELQLQHGREGVEQHALARILHACAHRSGSLHASMLLIMTRSAIAPTLPALTQQAGLPNCPTRMRQAPRHAQTGG